MNEERKAYDDWLHQTPEFANSIMSAWEVWQARAALAQPEPAVQPTAEDIAAIEAADALEAQAREIEALRADAARYRWLRDEDDDPVCSLRQLFTMTGKPKDVDAAVDAAMRKAVTP